MNKLKSIKAILLSPADDCGLFPIVARVGIYGFLLIGLLFIRAERFDDTELITTVSFISIVTVIEIMWKKTDAGKNMVWHISALLLLVSFLGLLLNQAIVIREAWFRVNVLEHRIQNVITEAPLSVIVADGNGNIKYMNGIASTLTGWTSEEVSGKPINILLRESKVGIHTQAVGKSLTSLEYNSSKWLHSPSRLYRLVRKDGTIIKTEMYVLGIRYSHDTERGIYPEGQDVEFYAIIDLIDDPMDTD